MSTASHMFITVEPGLNELSRLFPLPCEEIPTRGIQDGIILKFKTFYLKIYPSIDDISSYTVYGYRKTGSQSTEVFKHIVSYSKMKRYASQFISDNYLSEQYIIP